MPKRKKGNSCGYWDCNQNAREGDFLCAEHHEAWIQGFLDQCPNCHRFKDVMHRLCLDCYFGRPVAPWESPHVIPTQKKPYRIQLSDAWVDGYLRPDKFFVYILQFDTGDYYAGHTANLQKQIVEHREQIKSSTARVKATLQYVQIVATKRAAEMREAELKRLIESNPSQIQLMTLDFHEHMRELGCDDLKL